MEINTQCDVLTQSGLPPVHSGAQNAATSLTSSGLQRDSHIPYICSEHVPLTTKSSVSIGQPIRSIVAMYGSFVFGSSPAMTGSTK